MYYVDVLCAFEKLSGLKIYLDKSELFCFGEANRVVQELAEIFICQRGQLPMLGIPVHYRKLTISKFN